MKNRCYGIIVLFFWSAYSMAIEPVPLLSELVENALVEAEKCYKASSDEARNPSNLKLLIDTTFCSKVHDNNKVADMRALFIGWQPRLYDTTTIGPCHASVEAVDMSIDGRRVLAAIGKATCLWIKDGVWTRKAVLKHSLDITAVCFGPENTMVSADTTGNVFVTSYDENNPEKNGMLKKEYASYLPNCGPINMIAVNAAGNRLVCGNSINPSALSIYQLLAGISNKESAEIPIYEKMQPKALLWRDDTVIAYEGCNDDLQRPSQVTEWERTPQWECVKNIELDEDTEDTFLAQNGYAITRRDVNLAGSLSADKVVIGEREYLVIQDPHLTTYDEIIKALAQEWK